MDIKPINKEVVYYNPTKESYLVIFLYWWYIEEPKFLRLIYVSSLKSVYHLFSIPYLIKTLLSPWKRDITNVVNPTLQDSFKMIADNIISRFMGFFVRLSTIITGLIALFFVAILETLVLLVWYIFPLIFISTLFYGFYLMSK